MVCFARILVAVLLLVVLLPQSTHAREPFTLESVKSQVRRDYQDVGHLSTSALADMVRGEGNVLLFDVREPEEFAVSHIPGAQRVDPGTSRTAFLQRYRDKVADRVVVFYCSVGVRSSQMAQAVQAGLEKKGAKNVFNLDGGVFGWHNEKRPLENAKGETPYVHPYDSRWGKLVERKDLIRTAP